MSSDKATFYSWFCINKYSICLIFININWNIQEMGCTGWTSKIANHEGVHPQVCIFIKTVKFQTK